MEFNVGDHVYLRVSPTKGVQRFGIKGKLAPRYIGPYEIIKACGLVAYQLRLPSQLAVTRRNSLYFMYLNSRNALEFLQKSLNSKRSSWNQTFLMMSILSKFWTKKKEVLVERWLKCIKFSGIITLKKKLPGRLKVISINTIRVFFHLPQVPPYPSPFIYLISGRDSF